MNKTGQYAVAQAREQFGVPVTEKMVDAYCAAWIESFSEANPHHTEVECTAADREHIRKALIAAVNAGGRK